MAAELTPPEAQRQTAMRRPRLSLACRLALIALLLVGFWVLRMRPAEPEALAAAGAYLTQHYPGLSLTPPDTQRNLFGTLLLTYRTDYEGHPARIVVRLARIEGQLRVIEGRSYVGNDPWRYAFWVARAAMLATALYLVFFVAVPRRSSPGV